ncbi:MULTISPECIES: sodium-dependent transporter [Rhodococcus]|uniref:Transporter n=1 Tax=Rhodococcus aetherivorans TaxID=191292 RepID=A0ABQ0YMD2_9NOCA|nr:SNF family Na(+)-dependent transporter [Rhodococcus sp. WB1]GES37663.1 sodium-dependent transporter [Rhodococcus aetherivorans]CCW15165.1 Sodium-dependent transporter [Rhodococcus aetherivorans]
MTEDAAVRKREVWSGRSVFILAAIGSAVGLGNIWRFPYIAYENGGGAFIVPYLVALLTAGIPLLFVDYAIGHKFRGSPPLAFHRLKRATESLGWWQVGICFVIGVYYAVIIAWALRYTFFSATQAWGDDAETFFLQDFLQMNADATFGLDFVPGVAWPLLGIWLVVLVILGLGVQRGIGAANRFFVPLLLVLFAGMVVRALTLDGAATGLDAFFRPDWSALTDTGVWISAYAQIFFSLSVAFGIMVTYSSYLKHRTNLTGSGLVVGFSNSSFEILAGIGVFSALGFMAQAQGVAVDEVVSGGIGLAFIAFPTIVSEMPGGSLFGLLFFGSLVFAGFTSLISIIQVCVSAVEDKTGLTRVPAVLIVGGVASVTSLLLFPTTTGLNTLDVVDRFANQFGIVGVAFATLVVLAWGLRRLPELQDHLNSVSSFRVGLLWRVFAGVLTPIVLGYMLISEIVDRSREGYNDLPDALVMTFGWGVQALVIVIAVALSFAPWGLTDAELAHTESTEAGERL